MTVTSTGNGTAPVKRTRRKAATKTAEELTDAVGKIQEPVPEQEAIEIRPISREHIRVPVRGMAPLIISKFSKKARRQMLDAQQGNVNPKQNRNPEEEYFDAMYRFADGGFGIPASAFKEATVGAARYYKGVTMVEMRQVMFFRGEWSTVEKMSLIRILPQFPDDVRFAPTQACEEEDAWPRLREDVVRLAGQSRSADLRYRPEFPDWRAVLDVIFVKNSIAFKSVINLIEAGGLGVGVGEWRPQRRGEFGTYEVDTSLQVEKVDD